MKFFFVIDPYFTTELFWSALTYVGLVWFCMPISLHIPHTKKSLSWEMMDFVES